MRNGKFIKRDPARIPVVIQKLQELWTKYPDLRLGQLMSTVADHYDMFYMEDDKLLEALKAEQERRIKK